VKGRLLIGALGLVVGLYGAYLLLSRQDHDQLVSAAIWLASGVVLHDFVLAPVVLVLVAVGARVVPTGFRAAAVAGLVVLGTATVLAIPVLTGFGERPDNPSLLNRDYGTGWLVLAGLVLVAVVVGGLAARRRTGKSELPGASTESLSQ
jgi:hypothetical protein